MIMADDKKNTGEEILDRVMNHLADSVLALSEESILAEAGEPGADVYKDAEYVRLVLSEASQVLEDVTRRLSKMGHVINSDSWQRERNGYRTKCLNCGSPVRFTTATLEMQGRALDAPCCLASYEYTVPKRLACRK